MTKTTHADERSFAFCGSLLETACPRGWFADSFGFAVPGPATDELPEETGFVPDDDPLLVALNSPLPRWSPALRAGAPGDGTHER